MKKPNNNFEEDVEYIENENNEMNDYFKWVGSYLGYDITYSDDIDDFGREHIGERYRGSFACDEIPELNIGDCAIVNNKPSTHEGEHWLAIVRYSETEYLFFDSYGRNYLEIIPQLKKYLKDKNCNIFSTQHIRQNDFQQYCGVISLAWLVYVFNQPNPLVALII